MPRHGSASDAAALVDRMGALLSSLGLPSRVDPVDLTSAWPYVGSDKKRVGSAVRLPVVTSPGQSRLERVRLDALHGALLPT